MEPNPGCLVVTVIKRIFIEQPSFSLAIYYTEAGRRKAHASFAAQVREPTNSL